MVDRVNMSVDRRAYDMLRRVQLRLSEQRRRRVTVSETVRELVRAGGTALCQTGGKAAGR